MTIVHEILKQMPAVSKPQGKFLATLFVTILVLRGRVNFRNLSRYCDYSERTIARQFREPFDWPDFHQRVIMGALDPRSELVSAHDASFIPKSGKQTFGLGHFFNGCTCRAERGLEISTLAVVDVTRRCVFPLAVAQTPPGETRRSRRRPTGRHESGLLPAATARASSSLAAEVPYHCVDGYYAKKKYMDEVVSLDLHAMTKLRSDADCGFSTPARTHSAAGRGGNMRASQCPRLLPFCGPRHQGGGNALPLSTAVVWHNPLQRQLRLVVILNRKAPAKPRSIVLASTDPELNGRKLVDLYAARFQIEFLFRDSKQFTGLRDCQARAAAALDVHFNASLATLNLVRAEQLGEQTASTDRSSRWRAGNSANVMNDYSIYASRS